MDTQEYAEHVHAHVDTHTNTHTYIHDTTLTRHANPSTTGRYDATMNLTGERNI